MRWKAVQAGCQRREPCYSLTVPNPQPFLATCCSSQFGDLCGHLLGATYGVLLWGDNTRWSKMERLVCLPLATVKGWTEGYVQPAARQLTRTLLVKAAVQLDALGVAQVPTAVGLVGVARLCSICVPCTADVVASPASSYPWSTGTLVPARAE